MSYIFSRNMLAFNFKIILFSPCKFFTKLVCFTIPPVFITSFFQRQRVIIPKIISSILSVCNNIFWSVREIIDGWMFELFIDAQPQ